MVGFVGDRITFELSAAGSEGELGTCQAFLRTTIGSGAILNDEIVRAFETGGSISHAAWHDLPMERTDEGFRLSVILSETGFYRAKAYVVDERGHQHWPGGDDFGVSVHPTTHRTANTIYCAWPRLFGDSKASKEFIDPDREKSLATWDEQGYNVIPPSGTFRDLQGALEHIVDRLGCRILHLLPVNPTPTIFARFGRYGSPYASLDLTAVDPALVVFDREKTGIEQFCDLTRAAHDRGAKVFIDLVINHTGWGARLYENYPQWFQRQEDGKFKSPGAWGTTWEDLVELEHHDPALGQELAEVFLTWCRRGVDGFRCDAGYMVPLPVWRYITARVRREFPEAIFLLEGLGGAWEVTEQLLTEGGMQWAYSELFQNYSGEQVSWYTDYALEQSQRMGLYVNYSETHDNTRLAAKGKRWSLLRNHLCGLVSVNGAYGFTCGVEWLAPERIIVHQRTGLNWGSEDHIVEELARLNRLLANHPCFFDGATLRRLSPDGATVFALERTSADGEHRVLVLVNTDVEHSAQVELKSKDLGAASVLEIDLLQAELPEIHSGQGGKIAITLAAGGAHCLSCEAGWEPDAGERYRESTGVKGWIATVLQHVCPEGLVGDFDLAELSQAVVSDPLGFLSAIRARRSPGEVFHWKDFWSAGSFKQVYPKVILWEPGDERRMVPVPPDHWVVVRDTQPFELLLADSAEHPRYLSSVRISEQHWIACFDDAQVGCGMVELTLNRLRREEKPIVGSLELLTETPSMTDKTRPALTSSESRLEAPLVLLTNGRGAMSRLGVHFGQIKSKYDCLLGANLHAAVPVDRHVLAKRARVWVNAGGLITALSDENLVSFSPGPPAKWRFLICAGKGRWVPLELLVELMAGTNTVVIRVLRESADSVQPEDVAALYGALNAERATQVPAEIVDAISITVTLRVDIEDRGFHSETQRNSGSEAHFSTHSRVLNDAIGFAFTPAADRQLRVESDKGNYHAETEWCLGVEHPVEASRGQTGHGDAFSPGWFETSLASQEAVHFTVTADAEPPSVEQREGCFEARRDQMKALVSQAGVAEDDLFGATLVKAASAYVVQREQGMSVIAGYPWFLDWGRDSLICARGLLACGYQGEVVELLKVYGALEKDGTLPNSIHGEDTSNRDTSDAPLWYGMVCGDLVAREGIEFLQTGLGKQKKQRWWTPGVARPQNFAEVLASIAKGYLQGTPNGIRVDMESGLVWSPSHFTWMDTNYPAGTPREGYPVEIQVMWIQLLRLLDQAKIKVTDLNWSELADRALQSFEELFWFEAGGYYADLIRATEGQSAREGTVDTALRSNFPLAVSTGLIRGERARRAVQVALRHLMVPGGVRSLAALPVDVPLAVHSGSGQLLNDPSRPYWGRYEGDEDTRRKPAYHNGTVWGWPLGILCEAVLRAWDYSDDAKLVVRAYLGASERLLQSGCIGQLPEVMDGDAPHAQRGCDAQAWSVTEALRLWLLVNKG